MWILWDKSPLYTLFDEVAFSYEVGYIKPEAEIYEIALKKMNVKPLNSIFVGYGGSKELKVAKEMGIWTVLTSYFLKRDINQINEIKKFADYYIEDFEELRNIICE